jgi:hypothetical protein
MIALTTVFFVCFFFFFKRFIAATEHEQNEFGDVDN